MNMEEMSASTIALISALSALSGVTIGSLFSYFIAKKQINATVISANRQQWINTLRDCVSELLSLITPIAIYSRDDMWSKNEKLEKFNRAMLLRSKIKLLINPNENDHNELVNLIEIIFSRLGKEQSSENDKAIGQLQISITSQSQIILKKEWERVKKGK